jgi:hypothetical protein
VLLEALMWALRLEFRPEIFCAILVGEGAAVDRVVEEISGSPKQDLPGRKPPKMSQVGLKARSPWLGSLGKNLRSDFSMTSMGLGTTIRVPDRSSAKFRNGEIEHLSKEFA